MQRTGRPKSRASSTKPHGWLSACSFLSTLRREGWLIALVRSIVRALRLIALAEPGWIGIELLTDTELPRGPPPHALTARIAPFGGSAYFVLSVSGSDAGRAACCPCPEPTTTPRRQSWFVWAPH